MTQELKRLLAVKGDVTHGNCPSWICPEWAALFIGAAMLDTARMGNINKMQKSLAHWQRTNQELQKTLVELSKLASTDKLTGAWNRRRLEETLVNEMDRLKRYDHPLSSGSTCTCSHHSSSARCHSLLPLMRVKCPGASGSASSLLT